MPKIWWCVALMALSVATGFGGLYLAFWGVLWAALVGVTLSMLWGAIALVLVVLRSSPRRVRAQLDERVVERAMCALVHESKTKSRTDLEGKHSKAELVDRFHSTILKVLDG